MKILLIEDEDSLRTGIQQYLMAEGNVCDHASTFYDAQQKIALFEYDCILLDLNLPDGDGLELLRFLKSNKKTDGVIIISARNSTDQKIEGLGLGADDYLSKPFHLSELNARIKAVVRRRSFDGTHLVNFNEIDIDLDAKSVKINSASVYFTKKEFDLLVYFIANKNRVISKSAAVTHIWGDDSDMADSFDFIYTHIKNVRKKMTDSGCRDYFQSVYGIGYKFVAE